MDGRTANRIEKRLYDRRSRSRTYGQANEWTVEGPIGLKSDSMIIDLALSLCVCYIQHVWCHCEKLFSLDVTKCNRYTLSLNIYVICEDGRFYPEQHFLSNSTTFGRCSQSTENIS